MGKEEVIWDRQGTRRGSVVTGLDGKRTAYDKVGMRLGEYRPSNKATYDKWGNRTTTGDTVTNFIR